MAQNLVDISMSLEKSAELNNPNVKQLNIAFTFDDGTEDHYAIDHCLARHKGRADPIRVALQKCHLLNVQTFLLKKPVIAHVPWIFRSRPVQ